ncbi:hypothetical protein RRG08_005024 [Elysia crispata]|uniref:Uncharacterized protein n=1 Tax=Elysia crispata TaxID=231223 RepID=A0AAE1EA95_9GAST|nr:hypothetical protein RRG08_005024 [Elysia crispata]
MKLLCFVGVLVSLTNLAVGQQCIRISSFSAVALDTLNFVPSRAYYDVDNGYVYFKNNGNDGAQLVDFNVGAIYEKASDGSCVKYESDDLKLQGLGVPALIAATKNILTFTDISGVTREGKSITSGSLVIKDVFTSQCFNYFVSFTFNNEIKWAYLFIRPQTLSAADLQTVQTAVQAFEADSCTSTAI